MPQSLPYLSIEAIEKGEIKQYADSYSTVHSTEQDIFVVRTGGRNGLILGGKNGAVGSTLYCLTPLWINRDYLYYFLKLNEFSHSGQRDLSNTFWDIQIPIVSLEEQKQIASNIKNALSVFEEQSKDADSKLIQALKSLINVSSNTLEKIQNLDDFKKAVIELAVTGKLTNNSEHTSSFPNNNLVVKTKLDSILKNVETGKSFRCEERIPNNNEIGVAKISAISSGKYIESESKTCTNSEYFNPSYFIKNGDFLISRANTKELVGACAIAESVTKSIMLSDKILRLNLLDVNPKYILLSLKSRFSREQIEIVATGSQESMKNISQKDIRNIEIFLPSFLEQSKIVQVVENLFEIAENVNQSYKAEKQQQIELHKAILANFYKNLQFEGNIKQILLEIDVVRRENGLKITDLKLKQKQFRQILLTLKPMTILEVLQTFNKPMPINELLEKSKYNGNIEAFYEALKQQHEDGAIKWVLTEESSEVPQSMISLN